jgi:hypothetical protein
MGGPPPKQSFGPFPRAVVARHVPLTHPSPLGHLFPQPPQWSFDESVSTHAPLQSVVPGKHSSAQPVPAQTCGGVHVLPQPPQLFGSAMTGVQAPPPQSPVYGGHAQVLSMHDLPSPPHALPQEPQLAGSLVVSPHALWPSALPLS